MDEGPAIIRGAEVFPYTHKGNTSALPQREVTAGRPQDHGRGVRRQQPVSLSTTTPAPITRGDFPAQPPHVPPPHASQPFLCPPAWHCIGPTPKRPGLTPSGHAVPPLEPGTACSPFPKLSPFLIFSSSHSLVNYTFFLLLFNPFKPRVYMYIFI